MNTPSIGTTASWWRFLAVAIVVCGSATLLYISGQIRKDAQNQVRPRRTSNEQVRQVELRAGSNLAAAIAGAQCGDQLVLQAGATWEGSYSLPNKDCSVGAPITIRSSGVGALPSGRVSPADAVNMARVRSLSGEGAFKALNSAGGWILDGLEITDNAGTGSINALVSLGLGMTGVHDMTVQRCYIHQKETGTNYERSVIRGIVSEGTNVTVKWNYIGPFVGYPHGHGTDWTPFQSNAFECEITGDNILLEDNFLSAWYSTIWLGGADSGPAHQATLAAGATMTSATLTDVSGIASSLAAGEKPILRLQMNLTGTLSATTGNSATFTRTSGAALSASDILSGPFQIQDSSPSNRADVLAVSGNVYTLQWTGSSTHPVAGTYNAIEYKTVLVTALSGNTVTYQPVGVDQLTQSPSVPGGAAWAVLGESLIHNVTVRKNTFYIDPAFSQEQLTHTTNGPKGIWEIKNVYNMVVEGNRFLGFPSLMAWTGTNQSGMAPWMTVSHIIIRNNWYAPDLYPGYNAVAIYWLENQYRTGTQPRDLQVYNNLFRHTAYLMKTQTGDSASVYHNTIINDQPPYSAYSALIATEGVLTNFLFRDNIAGYQSYGMLCLTTGCTFGATWPGGIWRNNVIVDSRSDASGGFTSSTWGAGSILRPIEKSFNKLGFADVEGGDYRLRDTSSYKGTSTDGKDPGVDMNLLKSALADANPK